MKGIEQPDENLPRAGRLGLSEGGKGVFTRIWEWIAGVDLEREDESVKNACDLARAKERKIHEAANRDLDKMFNSISGIADSAEKFAVWQNWWMKGLEEYHRHDRKMQDISEIEQRLYMYNYIMSDPFFVRPLTRGVMRKIREGGLPNV